MTFVLQSNDNAIAISKPPLLALLTNAGNSSTATWTIPGNAGLFLKGQTLIDVLTCQSYNVDPVTGSLTVESKYGLPQVSSTLQPQKPPDKMRLGHLARAISG